jgi:hypothetical protein
MEPSGGGDVRGGHHQTRGDGHAHVQQLHQACPQQRLAPGMVIDLHRRITVGLFDRCLGIDHFQHPWERVYDDQDSDGDANDVVEHPEAYS